MDCTGTLYGKRASIQQKITMNIIVGRCTSRELPKKIKVDEIKEYMS